MHENPLKSMKIYGNQLKSMKYDENPQMPRSQPGIEQRFLEGQQKYVRHPYLEIRENPLKSMKIYEHRWKSIEHHENL